MNTAVATPDNRGDENKEDCFEKPAKSNGYKGHRIRTITPGQGAGYGQKNETFITEFGRFHW